MTSIQDWLALVGWLLLGLSVYLEIGLVAAGGYIGASMLLVGMAMAWREANDGQR